MPNRRDELPESVIKLLKEKGFYDKLIKRDPNETFVIRDLTGLHQRFIETYGKRKVEWDPGPSWQQVARMVFAWIPDAELRDIARWEDDGGRPLRHHVD